MCPGSPGNLFHYSIKKLLIRREFKTVVTDKYGVALPLDRNGKNLVLGLEAHLVFGERIST
jgi:hypothetical protein